MLLNLIFNDVSFNDRLPKKADLKGMLLLPLGSASMYILSYKNLLIPCGRVFNSVC